MSRAAEKAIVWSIMGLLTLIVLSGFALVISGYPSL